MKYSKFRRRAEFVLYFRMVKWRANG